MASVPANADFNSQMRQKKVSHLGSQKVHFQLLIQEILEITVMRAMVKG
jgi:hypothetical protein